MIVLTCSLLYYKYFLVHSFAQTDVVEYLLKECHADPNCTTKAGQTALSFTRDTSIIKLLLHHGATLSDMSKCSQFLPRGSTVEAAQSTVSVFMVGDKGAGKSTLTKALTTEKDGIRRLTARLSKVDGVKEKTAGIETHTIHSSRVGSLTIYDLAGHREFHSSHDTVIRSAVSGFISAIFLLVISLIASDEELKKTVFFWLSFIQNQLTSSSSATAYLLVIGSHAHRISSKSELRRRQELIREACIGVKVSEAIRLLDIVALDCQHSESSALNQLRKHVRDIQISLQQNMAFKFDLHCLHVLLVSVCGNQPGTQIVTVMQHIRERVKEQELEFLPKDMQDLDERCKELSSRGIVLYLRRVPVEQSWVIVERDVLLKHVNGTVFAPEGFSEHKSLAIHTGVVPYCKIEEHFTTLEATKHIDTELIVQFLCHMEFCQEVTDDHMLELLTVKYPHYKEQRHFLFPGLITERVEDLQGIESPADLWQPNPHMQYSDYSSCWVMQCHGHQHYLSPRFHQVLLLRLAFTHALPVDPHMADHTNPTLQQACTLWKNGIKWSTTSCVEVLVEISDRQVAVVMRCRQGMEMGLVNLRSKVLREVLSVKRDFCNNTEAVEMLVPNPQYPVNSEFNVALRSVAVSVAQHNVAALVNDSARTPLMIHALLHFEAYSFFPQERLYDICNSTHSVSPQFIECAATRLASVDDFCTTVDDFCTMLRVPIHRIESSSSKYQKVVEMFRVWQTRCEGTYQCLRQCLDEYSVFAGRSPLVSKTPYAVSFRSSDTLVTM